VKQLAAATVMIAFALTGSAIAGPIADKAQGHIAAIAKGDLPAITDTYDYGSTLHWIGGPLDGVYTGLDRLKEVWGKFAKAQGKLDAKVTSIAESANPKGGTVTANVVFAGQNTIKVRYVLLYRDDKLVGEIWQIDPNLAP
jgi:hypothetical protein